MATRANDLSADPAVALIEEPTESFDAWLHELLSDPPVEVGTTGADLVAQARAGDASHVSSSTHLPASNRS